MAITAYSSFLSRETNSPVLSGSFSADRLLVPIVGVDSATIPGLHTQAAVAAGLARCQDADLLVMDLAAGDDEPTPVEPSALLDRVTAGESPDSRETTRRRTSSRPIDRPSVKRIVRAVESHDVDAVALGSVDSIESPRPLLLPPAERIAAAVPCDAVVVNGKPTEPRISSILLPIAGGPHSGMATDVARCLATEMDAWIDVLHVADGARPGDRPSGRDYVAAALDRLEELDQVDTWVLHGEDIAGTIIEQSRYYDMTILGAPSKGRLQQFIFGSTTHEIRTDVKNTALMVRDRSA